MGFKRLRRITGANAIWNALLIFDRLPTGFCNRDRRNNLAELLGQPVEQFTQARMSYQLRLRLHGLIERIPKTHRYRLTSFVFSVAFRLSLFFCKNAASLRRDSQSPEQ